MKYLIIIVIFYTYAVFSQTLERSWNYSDKQVITEDMIKAAGILNISDILTLADKWNLSTIDGSTAMLSANDLSSYQRQNFIVLIDSQRYDVSIFDQQNLNNLPISIDQIDYVEFINNPEIYNGEFTSSGLIHFHTKVPSKGLSIQLIHSVGNETGDPGPYDYTTYTSPNVDKLSYILGLHLETSGEKWFLQGGVKHEENFDTDPAIGKRISNLYPNYNKAYLNSYMFRLGVKALGGEHRILAGFTDHQDFFFLKPYGNEIPAQFRNSHIGFNGSIRAANKLSANYFFKFSNIRLDKITNKLNIGIDFGMRNYSARIEAHYTDDNFHSFFGLSYEKTYGESSLPLTNNVFIFRKIYGEVDLNLSSAFCQSLGVYGTDDEKSFAIKGILKNKWQLSHNQSVKSFFSLSQKLPAEDLNYWNWIQTGYVINFPDFPGQNILGSIKTNSLFAADVIYTHNIKNFLNFQLGANYRYFSDFYVEKQYYQYDLNQNSFFAPVDVFTNANLKTIGANALLTFYFSNKLNTKMFYSYQKDIWGTDLFRNIWKEIPEQKISIIINYLPFEDFMLWGRFRYLSSTSWYQYKYILSQADDKYTYILKPEITFDMAAQKWFWGRRIWTSLLFRDVFNQKEVYNPIGANFNLRFYLQVHIYLNSIIE